MKIHYLVALFFLLVIFPKTVFSTNIVDSLNTVNSRLVVSLDSANKVINEQIKVIGESKNTINLNTSLLSGFGYIYIVITILVTIVGIVLPIVQYFKVNKEVEDAMRKVDGTIKKMDVLEQTIKNELDNTIKKMGGLEQTIKSELEQTIKSRISAYLDADRQAAIDSAIDNLTDTELSKANNALIYLQFNQYNGFTDEQLSRLCETIAKTESNQVFSRGVATLLLSKEATISTLFFKTVLQKNTDYLLNLAYQYFAIRKSDKSINDYIEHLKSREKRADTLMNIIRINSIINPDSIVGIINNEGIVNLFFGEDLERIKQEFQKVTTTTKKEKDLLLESKLYQKAGGA